MQIIWIISFTFSNSSYSFISIYCHECIIISYLVSNLNHFRFHKKLKQMRWIANYFNNRLYYLVILCIPIFWHDNFSLQHFIEIWPKIDFFVWDKYYREMQIFLSFTQWSWKIMYVKKRPWLSTFGQSIRNI